MDPEEERRGPGRSSVFFERQRFNNKGENCMECKLNNKGENCMECTLDDPPRGHKSGHRLLDDIATSIA